MRRILMLVAILTAISPCVNGEEEAIGAYRSAQEATHWSVYVPIVLIAGAAWWFASADGQDCGYGDSQDALGSIINSKRRDSSSSHRSSYTARSRTGASLHAH